MQLVICNLQLATCDLFYLLFQGFLELSADQKAEVVKGLEDVDVDELTRRIEEMARLH